MLIRKRLNHRGELTFYSLKDHEFQQAETIVELHSFTFLTIYLYSF
jgi:hypothetical protein